MSEQSQRGPLWMSIIGRSAVAVLVTLVGLILGLVGGGYRGYIAANAIPPASTTMGFESAGIAPFLLFAVHLALGGVCGAVVGLVVGVVGALIWPRSKSRSGGPHEP